MGCNNSIRNNLSKSDIISTIKLSLAADIKSEKAFIVVEGIDDIAFLKKNIRDNITIYESFSGKEGVKEIVKFINCDSVIGICDRDYELELSPDRIFYYDYSCLEMMLISNDKVFAAIANEYYSGNCKSTVLKEKLLKDLSWLSCLRKLNYDNNWNIRFDGFSIHNSIEDQCFSLSRALSEFAKINSRFLETHRESIKKAAILSSTFNSTEALLTITQGHDFIYYFHAICSELKGACRHCKIESIASSLRCAYRLEDFQESELCKEINKYSLSVNIFFLLM